MNRRRSKLSRLLTVRQLQEELDRCTLQSLSASVAEVERALESQQGALLEAGQEARHALSVGGREQWLLAEARREVSESNKARLALVLSARRAALDPAMKRFLNSRREHEEMKQIVDDAKRSAATVEDRKLQATADDWFLSRFSASSKKTPK